MVIKVMTRDVALALGSVALALFSMHMINVVAAFLGHPVDGGVIGFFNLEREQNPPTLFATCLFLLIAALCLCVWRAKQGAEEARAAWLVLTAMFAFLALDEFALLHERLEGPTRALLGVDRGDIAVAWVIPYGVLVLLLAGFFLPLWLRRSPRIRVWLVASVATFLAGAIGLELIGVGYLFGLLQEGVGSAALRSPGYQLFVGVEEGFEMAGLVMLICTLVELMRVEHGGFSITFE